MQSYRRRLIYGLATVLVLGALTGAWIWTRVMNPLPDAADLLRTAVDAGDRVTYSAEIRSTTFYPGRNVKIKSRISHTPDAQRIQYIDGPIPGLVVISRGNETYTVKPKTNAAMMTESSGHHQADMMELLLKNHAAVVSGTSRIAGRSCYVVDVMPKDVQGPSKRLYIDRQEHVILRTDDRTSEGKLRTSSEMTHIDYAAPIPENSFALPEGTEVSRLTPSEPEDSSEMSKRLGFDVKRPQYMTAGYTAETQRLYRCGCQCGHESAHMSYTNGLSAVSIFQTSKLAHCGSETCDLMPGSVDRDGCMISDSRQGRTVISQRPDKTVIVVGDLDCSELKKIAKSVP